jgi:hypothetical protein
MSTPTTPDPAPAATENPLATAATVAHGWYGKLAALAHEAQADLEKYLPAGAVQSVEQTVIKDVEDAAGNIVK